MNHTAAQTPTPTRARPATPVGPDPRRWLILAVVALAQLMVVLDATIVNIALPSAQHALGFSDIERQWVVTAYSLAFGSLLLLGGRLTDLIGRKATFIAGLIGFAGASAAGGAAGSFGMLVVARACQGAFGALLAPAALSLLTVTFRDSKDRGKAFGVFGAIAAGGGAVGLLLGGLLTQYLDWRWCLYVNLVFAAARLRRRGPAAAPAASRAAATAGPARPGHRSCRHVLRRLRLLQRRQRRLARPGHLGFPRRGRGTTRRVRLHRDAGQPAAAATADRRRPQPGRVLPVDPHHRRRHVRHLLVPDLLPARDPGLQPGDGRPGLPAHGRGDRRLLEPGQHRAAAPHRPQVPRRIGHARRRGRPGLADPDRRALQLRRQRPAGAAAHLRRARLRDVAVDEHRDRRRGAVRRRHGLRRGQHRAAGRRLDRHVPAQHRGGQRGRQLPGRSPQPPDGGRGQADRAADRARPGAQLHHRILVGRRDIRRRLRPRCPAVPPRRARAAATAAQPEDGALS